jgi:hypothetical protein
MGIRLCTTGWISVKSCAELVDEMWVTIHLVLTLTISAGQSCAFLISLVDESKYQLLTQ